MTVQEAIDVFEKPSDHIKTIQINHVTGIVYSADLVKAFEMAIEALEKQIPMKPIITIASEEVEYMKCLGCGLTTVLYYGMRPNYCGNCGQKLRWD